MSARVSLLQVHPTPARPPLPGGLVGASAPPLRLPGEHFAAALAFFTLGAAGLVWLAPDLALGAFFVPSVAAVVHLFTLGFISTSIFGALYQFLPVAVGAPIRSQRLAHVTFAVLVSGVVTLVTALALSNRSMLLAGGVAVALAFALFATNLGATLATAKERSGVTYWALVGACAFLVATLALGLTLVLGLIAGFAAPSRFELLAVHVHVAVAGWVMLVMVGVGHRLLPMFMLSHGASELPARVAVACLALGSSLLLLPLGGAVRRVAFAVIAAGVVAFLVQARAFHRHRTKRALDEGMRLAMAGLAGVGAALLLAPLALLQGFANTRLVTAYAFVLVVGGISLFIAGHYFKIVPFLIWYHRFGDRVGKGKVPRVADLFVASRARAAGLALVAGVVGVAAGILLGSAPVVRAFAVVYLAGVLVEVREMIRIAARRPT